MARTVFAVWVRERMTIPGLGMRLLGSAAGAEERDARARRVAVGHGVEDPVVVKAAVLRGAPKRSYWQRASVKCIDRKAG